MQASLRVRFFFFLGLLNGIVATVRETQARLRRDHGIDQLVIDTGVASASLATLAQVPMDGLGGLRARREGGGGRGHGGAVRVGGRSRPALQPGLDVPQEPPGHGHVPRVVILAGHGVGPLEPPPRLLPTAQLVVALARGEQRLEPSGLDAQRGLEVPDGAVPVRFLHLQQGAVVQGLPVGREHGDDVRVLADGGVALFTLLSGRGGAAHTKQKTIKTEHKKNVAVGE